MFIDQNESTARRKPVAANVQWSDKDKSLEFSAATRQSISNPCVVDLFLTLLSQHGDDFKRIAASMPNKVTYLNKYTYTFVDAADYWRIRPPFK